MKTSLALLGVGAIGFLLFRKGIDKKQEVSTLIKNLDVSLDGIKNIDLNDLGALEFNTDISLINATTAGIDTTMITIKRIDFYRNAQLIGSAFPNLKGITIKPNTVTKIRDIKTVMAQRNIGHLIDDALAVFFDTHELTIKITIEVAGVTHVI